MEKKETLPNSVAVLVLGICSIVFGCLFIGLILGIIGLALSGKGKRIYKENPDNYTGYGMLNAGFVMSIIGTVLGSLYIVYYVIVILIIGAALPIFMHL
jgi:hypothetical protein